MDFKLGDKLGLHGIDVKRTFQRSATFGGSEYQGLILQLSGRFVAEIRIKSTHFRFSARSCKTSGQKPHPFRHQILTEDSSIECTAKRGMRNCQRKQKTVP